MIDDVFYINLEIRPDRKQQFLSSLPEKLGVPTRWEAVHGDSCPHPAWWNAGRGAWGCYRSHINLLEYCMTKQIPRYMVFEDDAVFVPDFERKYQAFLEELPCDWDMFYLGGQLLHTQHAYAIPEKVSEHVYRPYNVNRTHCFAVNSSGYKYLYDFLLRRFENNEWHIDHHLGRLHEQAVLNVYCSATWLVGQREGSSNIDGKTRETDVFFPSAKFYHKTSLEYSPYCVVLFTSEEVARELTAKHHWHSGFSKDDRFIDKGLKNIYRDTNLKLRQWYYYIRRECMQKNFVPFLWHPHLKEEDFKTLSLPFKPIYITALTAEEAVECLKSETL